MRRRTESLAKCLLPGSGLRDSGGTKGLFALTLLVALSLCLSSCGGDGPTVQGGDTDQTDVDVSESADASDESFDQEDLGQLNGFLDKFASGDWDGFGVGSAESEPTEESGEATSLKTDGETYRVGIDIECEENVMFSKYDVEILVDGESIGVVGHGMSKAFEVALFEGRHTIEARKKGDAGVNGSLDFMVAGDALQGCLIRCKESQAQILNVGSFGSVEDSLESLGQEGEELARLFDSLGVDEMASVGFDDDEDFLNCRDGEWAARKNFENYGEVLYPNGFDCFWKTGLVACELQEDGSYRIEVNTSVVSDDGFSDKAHAGGIVKDGDVSDFWVDMQ